MERASMPPLRGIRQGQATVAGALPQHVKGVPTMNETQQVCPTCSSDNIYAEQLGPLDFAFGCNRCGEKFRTPRDLLLNPLPVETPPPPQPEAEKPKRPLLLRLLNLTGNIVGNIIVVGIVLGLIFMGYNYGSLLDTGSMEPTMSGSDFVWFNPFANNFQRGDIVTFHEPSYSAEHDLLKRVIGLPGETVSITRGQVFINQRPLNEPWMRDFAKAEISAPSVTLGTQEYYVLGDNRKHSYDSTEIGPVHQDRIGNKVFLHLDLNPISVNFGDGLKRMNKSSLAQDAVDRVIEANWNVPIIY